MAIAQANLQNPLNANPLQSILQGNEVIMNILNNAAADARNRVNNQTRQDAQLVENMQLAQGFSQRRAQDLDQRLIDTRNFNYRQEQDAIANDLRQRQFDAVQEERGINQGFRQDALNIQQQAVDARTAQSQARLAEEQRKFNALNTAATPDFGSVPTVENTPEPPSLEEIGAAPSQPQLSNAELDARIGILDESIKAAREVGNTNQLNQNIRQRAEYNALKEQRKASGETNLSPSETRIRENEERNRVSSEMKRQNEVDISDTGAFPLPDTGAQRRLEQAIAATPRLTRNEALASLNQGDRDAIREASEFSTAPARLSRELAAVQRYDSAEAYVNAGGTGLSEAAKKLRRDFYNRNKGVVNVAQPQGGELDLNF